MAAAAQPAVTAGSSAEAFKALIRRISRDQGPEFDQSMNFNPLGLSTTLVSLKTDRKIKIIDIHVRGRITNGGAPVVYRAGPPLLGTPLFSLIQQITLRGQHQRYGTQSPIVLDGETAAEIMALMYANWTPTFAVSVNGGAMVRSGTLSGNANATNDFEFVLPVATYPETVSDGDQVFHCLHGPDWPGNLYLDLACADETALGVAAGSVTFGPFGGGAGSMLINILTERPLLTAALAAKIRPAVLFRTTSFTQPTQAVSGVSGAGIKITDLTVGKNTTRLMLKTGVQLAGTSAGVVVFAPLSDGIITRTSFSVDDRDLRFQKANQDIVLQDYMGRMYHRTIPVGYKIIDFIGGTGKGPGNPKASFESAKLTAARKFQMVGDVVAAGNQIAEVVQEMLLGRAQILQ